MRLENTSTAGGPGKNQLITLVCWDAMMTTESNSSTSQLTAVFLSYKLVFNFCLLAMS